MECFKAVYNHLEILISKARHVPFCIYELDTYCYDTCIVLFKYNLYITFKIKFFRKTKRFCESLCSVWASVCEQSVSAVRAVSSSSTLGSKPQHYTLLHIIKVVFVRVMFISCLYVFDTKHELETRKRHVSCKFYD